MKTFKLTNMLGGKIGHKLYANAPTIITIASVIGYGVTIYEACKATTKLDAAIAEPTAKIKDIKSDKENLEDKIYRKELTKQYAKMVGAGVRLYAPSLVLGAASTFGVLYSHGMMTSRLATSLTSLAAAEETYREYRDRVIKRFGTEVDNDILNGNEIVEVDVPEFDKKGNPKLDKNGLPVSHKEEVKVHTLDFINSTRIFDDYSTNALANNNAYNASFVVGLEDALTLELRRKGHLWENYIWDRVGVPESDEGCTNGLVYDLNDPDHHVNRVDLGIRTLVVNEDGKVVSKFTDEFLAYEKGETDTLWLTLKTDGKIAKYLFSTGPVKKNVEKPKKQLRRILPGKIEVYA